MQIVTIIKIMQIVMLIKIIREHLTLQRGSTCTIDTNLDGCDDTKMQFVTMGMSMSVNKEPFQCRERPRPCLTWSVCSGRSKCCTLRQL